jgi:hypothetical protein
VKNIESDARLQQICSSGIGFVFNDFSGSGPSGGRYNLLHAAGCRWLERSNASVRKVWFENEHEALSWLQRERGAEGSAWRRCGTCGAGRTSRHSPAPQPAAPPRSRQRAERWEIEAGSHHVAAWSVTRLPFEPIGFLAEFRTALVQALRSMHGSPGEQLHAVYTSTAGQDADIENVLVYNVGASAFAPVASGELLLERAIADPPPSASRLPHHSVYELRSRGEPWAHWTVRRTVASFGLARIPRPTAGLKPGPVWHAVVHDGSGFDDPLIARLSAQLGIAPSALRRLLLENDHAMLGPRRLVSTWRQGVKWNPADHRLLAIRLATEIAGDPGDARWRLSGTISEIVPH